MEAAVSSLRCDRVLQPEESHEARRNRTYRDHSPAWRRDGARLRSNGRRYRERRACSCRTAADLPAFEPSSGHRRSTVRLSSRRVRHSGWDHRALGLCAISSFSPSLRPRDRVRSSRHVRGVASWLLVVEWHWVGMDSAADCLVKQAVLSWLSLIVVTVVFASCTAASGPSPTSEQERCRQTGGTWRGAVCERSGGGGY